MVLSYMRAWAAAGALAVGLSACVPAGMSGGAPRAIAVAGGAVTTVLLAGIPLPRLLEILGQAFVDNRLMTLFLLTLPAIGIAEKYGLREESARLIRRIRAATPRCARCSR